MRKDILVVCKAEKVLFDKLEGNGFVVDYKPDLEQRELLEIIHNYSGLVLRSKHDIDRIVIDKGCNLKFIARMGVGVEHIDVDYAESKGINCMISPEASRDTLAEHTMGMILTLMNKLNIANYSLKRGVWDRKKTVGHELLGKTVGIIGYGNMGSALARRLMGFGVRVLSYDKYKIDYSDGNTIECDMNTIFEESDILSLHIPLTDETRYLVNYDYLKKFKKDIYLINTARGKIVKTDELNKSLDSGKLIGVALDVIEFEKKGFTDIDFNNTMQRLAAYDNVMLTPHIAGSSKEVWYKHASVIADKICNL